MIDDWICAMKSEGRDYCFNLSHQVMGLTKIASSPGFRWSPSDVTPAMGRNGKSPGRGVR